MNHVSFEDNPQNFGCLPKIHHMFCRPGRENTSTSSLLEFAKYMTSANKSATFGKYCNRNIKVEVLIKVHYDIVPLLPIMVLCTLLRVQI